MAQPPPWWGGGSGWSGGWMVAAPTEQRWVVVGGPITLVYTQVLEYEHTSDTWTPKGNITGARAAHGMVAVGPQDLPCLTGS